MKIALIAALILQATLAIYFLIQFLKSITGNSIEFEGIIGYGMLSSVLLVTSTWILVTLHNKSK